MEGRRQSDESDPAPSVLILSIMASIFPCVSVLLGHASTATTNRYYARTRERAAIDAVRRAWETSSQTRSEEEREKEVSG